MERTLAKLRNREPTTIVVLGNSISVETMWTFGRKTWVHLLSEALWYSYGDGFIWVVNSAKCGNSYAQELERLSSSVLRFRPDLVINGIFVQDKGRGEEGFAECRDEGRAMVRRIREECGSEVLFQIPNPIVFGFWDPRPQGAPKGDAYEGAPRGEERRRGVELTRELARELDCPVVDHDASWKAHRKAVPSMEAHPQGLWMRMADIVHPNSVGHLAIFRDMAPVFGLPRYFPWEEVEENRA